MSWKLTRPQVLIFLYLVFPTVVATSSSLQGVGRSAFWPLEFRLAYYVPFSIIGMIATGIMASVLAHFLRPYKVPLWIVLPLSVVLGGPVSILYATYIGPLFQQALPEGTIAGERYQLTPEGMIIDSLPAIVTWTTLNMFLLQGMKIPRFGYFPSSSDADESRFEGAQKDGTPPAPTPSSTIRFLERAGLPNNTMVIALEAQQHYVKIYTEFGSHTVLSRFSDAVAELPADVGLRVHRSWWVRKKAVVSVSSPDRPKELTLSSGLVVPVSRSYRILVSSTFNGVT